MEQLFRKLNVSRETIDKLSLYVDLVSQWNRKTALVQIKTMDEFWHRHILDSLQLLAAVNFENKKIIDIGTGAGLPGMILAIAGIENITLLDSSVRKCVFLEEVARILNVKVTVINCRCEDIKEPTYDLVLSRACCQLSELLTFMKHVSRETKNALGYFHKGLQIDAEIAKALQEHQFEYEKIPSITSTDGAIIRISNLH